MVPSKTQSTKNVHDLAVSAQRDHMRDCPRCQVNLPCAEERLLYDAEHTAFDALQLVTAVPDKS